MHCCQTNLLRPAAPSATSPLKLGPQWRGERGGERAECPQSRRRRPFVYLFSCELGNNCVTASKLKPVQRGGSSSRTSFLQKVLGLAATSLSNASIECHLGNVFLFPASSLNLPPRCRLLAIKCAAVYCGASMIDS